MPEISIQVLVQYVVSSELTTGLRPYSVSSALAKHHEVFVNVEPLPMPEHWKVVMEGRVSLTAADGVKAMDAVCVVEAITRVHGVDALSVDAFLRENVAPAVVGSLRAQLNALTAQTGFGAQTLPPYTGDMVAAFPSKA